MIKICTSYATNTRIYRLQLNIYPFLLSAVLSTFFLGAYIQPIFPCQTDLFFSKLLSFKILFSQLSCKTFMQYLFHNVDIPY